MPTQPTLDWEAMFAAGRWDYLDEIGEAPRYALIAGYIRRLVAARSVLDVGCGAGILRAYLAGMPLRYDGIDLSPSAIARATARHPAGEGVAWQAVDVAAYAPARRFDAIVFNEVLPHVARPLETLSRYLDFLAPGGIMLVSTYQNPNPASAAARFTVSFDDALAGGRYARRTGCTVSSVEQGLRWRIDVLAGPVDG